MKVRLGKWAALVVFLVTLLVSGVAFGEDPGPCYEAYLQSGLTEQEISFDDFRHSYADSFCATDGGGLQATLEGRGPDETR
jgi:hypothetical protein